MAPSYTLKKAERLSLKKRIEMLFSAGSSLSLYPVKILWLPFDGSSEFPVQFMCTVSSKRFKNAVTRNRIKRRVKEIFRLRKSILYEELDKDHIKLLICIIYTGNDPYPGYADLDKVIGKSLDSLIRTLRSAG